MTNEMDDSEKLDLILDKVKNLEGKALRAWLANNLEASSERHTANREVRTLRAGLVTLLETAKKKSDFKAGILTLLKPYTDPPEITFAGRNEMTEETE